MERLLGELQEFKRNTARQLEHLENQIEHLENKLEVAQNSVLYKIEELNQFKWKVVGGASVMSFLITVGIEMIRFLKKD